MIYEVFSNQLKAKYIIERVGASQASCLFKQAVHFYTVAAIVTPTAACVRLALYVLKVGI